MKHKRLLTASLVCILVASVVIVGWSVSSRLVRAYSYASQFAAAAKVSESSTNLSLVVYGDPQPLRPTRLSGGFGSIDHQVIYEKKPIETF